MKNCVLVTTITVLGLAGAASAQLASTNAIPGAWINIASPVNDTGLHGDDAFVAFTATHGNKILNPGLINISTNGVVTDVPFTNFSNNPLPIAGLAGYFPYWDDLYNVNPGEGNIYAANLPDRTVIEWDRMQLFPGGGTPSGTFQLQIFDDAPGGAGTGPGGVKAQFLFENVAAWGNGISATIGAQNSSSFTQWSFNTASVANGMTVSIYNLPAPGSLALLGLGGLFAGRRRR